MNSTPLSDAISRLRTHYELKLPLPRWDLLGRFVLRFLWRRHIKSQVDVNLAIRDAVELLADAQARQQSRIDDYSMRIPDTGSVVTSDQLSRELDALRRDDENMMAGLTQRLYSSVGPLQTQLADLRLQLSDEVVSSTAFEQRISSLEHSLTAIESELRALRLEHAHLRAEPTSPHVEEARTGPAGSSSEVPTQRAYLELAVAELIDGPKERARASLQENLEALRMARGAGTAVPVLDMAPCRGEWLQVLRSADVPYHTASPNPLVRSHAESYGLTIPPGDTLDLLADTPSESLGAITAFRYVERLEPSALAHFVDLAVTKLHAGGLLLIESPSPSNAGMALANLDTFSRHPVHPDFLRLLTTASGFATTEVQPIGGAMDTAARYKLYAWR